MNIVSICVHYSLQGHFFPWNLLECCMQFACACAILSVLFLVCLERIKDTSLVPRPSSLGRKNKERKAW